MRPSAAQQETDAVHMARCVELARKYLGRTSPNPIVGCVIVGRNGEVLAEGAHKGPGTDHAEIVALKKLKLKAPGATLYCNLEPCNHHGRTPPCAPVIREAGVARVVIGTDDPIQGHGGGIEHLRRGKISTSVGVLREYCDEANRAFLTWAVYGRPTFTLKAAITLDGKICTVAGKSKWITGMWARADARALRDRHDAVLVGIGTVLADDPWLTTRLEGGRNAKRIVVDSQLRTPVDAHLLPRKTGLRTIIATSMTAPASREKALAAMGAEIWRLPSHRNGKLDLNPLARRLAEEDFTSVLVEGGGEIHAYMLEKRMADSIIIYLAPKVVGGPAKSWVGGKGIGSIGAAYGFIWEGSPLNLDGDLRLRAVRGPPIEKIVEQPFEDDDD